MLCGHDDDADPDSGDGDETSGDARANVSASRLVVRHRAHDRGGRRANGCERAASLRDRERVRDDRERECRATQRRSLARCIA